MIRKFLLFSTFLIATANFAPAQSNIYAKYNSNIQEQVSFGLSENMVQVKSFLEYFQFLYKYGYFEQMLDNTSNSSLSKYGRQNVWEMYKKSDFGYKNLTLINKRVDGNGYELTYKTDVFTQNKYIKIKIVFEDNKTKIVLKDIKNFYYN